MRHQPATPDSATTGTRAPLVAVENATRRFGEVVALSEAVALAFVGRPRVVLLDEPTTGLDVTARNALWKALRNYHSAGGTGVSPPLAMFFFVVPQKEVAGDPLHATVAVASLSFFAICSANLFTHGLGVAEDRALPFDTLMRCLPAGPGPRVAGRILNGTVFSLLALVPLVLIGWVFTEAGAPVARLAAGIGVLLVAGVPFVLLGLAIRYAMSAKAAIAVVQVTLFPLAFLGGLFLPPFLFPAWLNTISLVTPTRAGRDILVQVLTGESMPASSVPVLVGWTVVFAALAVAAYRRDEGRRYR